MRSKMCTCDLHHISPISIFVVIIKSLQLVQSLTMHILTPMNHPLPAKFNYSLMGVKRNMTAFVLSCWRLIRIKRESGQKIEYRPSSLSLFLSFSPKENKTVTGEAIFKQEQEREKGENRGYSSILLPAPTNSHPN